MGKTILIASALYAPHMGGVENYTEKLAGALTAQGHHVIVITHQLDALDSVLDCSGDIDVMRLPCTPLMDGRYPAPRRNHLYKSLLSWLERKPIDHVIVNTRFYPLSFEIAALANAHGIRPVIVEHGSAHLTAGSLATDAAVSRTEHLLTARIKTLDADYYGVSTACCAWLEHFGIKACGVLPNSIDAHAFCNARSQRDFRAEIGAAEFDFIVAFTGRFNPEKGIKPLVKAAEMLSKRSDIHFIFAGQGPLKELIDETHSPNVHNVGKLSAADVASLLLTSDAFCLPSRSEGFSTSLLEAAACGAVPIITHVGGVEELIPDDRFGIVLPAAKPKHIAHSVTALASNRFTCAEMGELIRTRVSELYSWDATAERVLAACEYANAREVI